MALNLLGEVFAFGITLRILDNIDGIPHKLQKTFSYKSNAEEYAEYLRKQGKDAKLVAKTDTRGHEFYVIYVKVEGREE